MSLGASARRRLGSMLGQLKEAFSQGKSFGFLLALATLPPILWVLGAIPEIPDARSLFYKYSIPGYYAFLVLVPSLAATMLFPKALRRLYLFLLGTLWLSYLVADIFVFDAYKFHINLFLLQFFFTNHGEMGITPLLAFLGLGGLLLCVGTAWGFVGLAMKNPRWLRLGASLGLLVTVTSFAANQVVHVWGEYFKRIEITGYSSYLPVFFPATSQKTAPKISRLFPGWLPPEQGTAGGAQQQAFSNVNYPLAMPANCKAKPKENILFIVLESWQADGLDAKVMPNLAELASQSWQFKRHVSGGNGTVPGLFSALFGLHGSYYDAFRANPAANASLLTRVASQQQYLTRVFTSGNLERFSLRPLFFPAVGDDHYHFVDGSSYEGDARVVETLENSLKTAPGKESRFDFVYLMASHFPYAYPPSFTKFLPVPEREGEQLVNKGIDPDPVKNDYHNSLNYLDHLLGKLFATMKRQGVFDNTWIVVIGDHAEEFNENQVGHWGHGSNFGRWQTQTPLILKKARNYSGSTDWSTGAQANRG